VPASRPSESPKGVGSGRCTMVHFPVAFAQKPSFRCRLLSGPMLTSASCHKLPVPRGSDAAAFTRTLDAPARQTGSHSRQFRPSMTYHRRRCFQAPVAERDLRSRLKRKSADVCN
jgi:hypothetical protein